MAGIEMSQFDGMVKRKIGERYNSASAENIIILKNKVVSLGMKYCGIIYLIYAIKVENEILNGSPWERIK